MGAVGAKVRLSQEEKYDSWYADEVMAELHLAIYFRGEVEVFFWGPPINGDEFSQKKIMGMRKRICRNNNDLSPHM